MDEHIARFSDHVNDRYNDPRKFLRACYLGGMPTQWKSELRKAIAASGLSMREISRRIGAGPNAVSEIFTTDKEPGVDKVLAIIDAIGASRSAILVGHPMSREVEDIVSLLARIGPEAQRSALQFLTDLQGLSDGRETPGAAPHPAAET